MNTFRKAACFFVQQIKKQMLELCVEKIDQLEAQLLEALKKSTKENNGL